VESLTIWWYAVVGRAKPGWDYGMLQIWSVAMMLDHLGQPAAGQAVVDAIEAVLTSPDRDRLITPDLGGTGTTAQLGAAIAAALP
jgi:tartrate dehydrogenase/decarboxylase/D-malate dehydrogenase